MWISCSQDGPQGSQHLIPYNIWRDLRFACVPIGGHLPTLADVERRCRVQKSRATISQAASVSSSAERYGLVNRTLDDVADTVGGRTAEKLIAKVKPGGVYASVVGPWPPGDENSVILIQARCDDIGDTSWIFEPSQAVAEFQIVLKLCFVR